MTENKELVKRLRSAVVHAPKASSDDEYPASKEVSDWLLLLAPASSLEIRSLSQDLSLVGNVVNSIAEAEEENILSEAEANAITLFILGKFVERRLESTMRDVFAPSKQRWQYAASGSPEDD